MQAETLNCPTCGAAVMTDATHCSFCSARLATVACARCFGMMFAGSLHCSHCGAKAGRAEASDAQSRRCPRCRVEMETITVGGASLRECARCDGLWVDVASFEQIIAEREQQSAVLGDASFAHGQTSAGSQTDKVRYVPCPECGQLMNRVNFARCSGVVVDVCKGHGTWFDRDELRRIVEFIRGGGLEESRAREKMELKEERNKLRQEQLAEALRTGPPSVAWDEEDRRPGIVSAAREILKLLRN